MAEKSKIQWTHHTFNAWRGCTKVSPGCQHCYAETLSKRNPKVLGEWGDEGVRVIASESYWREPVRWNAAAGMAAERHRVFCLSLGDVFEDRPELIEPRTRLLRLIHDTQHLDWLLLTKRPQNWRKLLMDCWRYLAISGELCEASERTLRWIESWLEGLAPSNVWVGVSVEDQLRLHRIYDLMSIPAVIHFLSCEPLLGPLDFVDGPIDKNSTMGEWSLLDGIDWVIVGGESGSVRTCHVQWIRNIIQQCRRDHVNVFVKQLGANPIERGSLLRLKDAKGGDPDEWPEDVRIREIPQRIEALGG